MTPGVIDIHRHADAAVFRPGFGELELKPGELGLIVNRAPMGQLDDGVRQEIEERKRQLKDAAIGDQSENAITNEVRDFARTNPEITANLLRTWLKGGE